MTLREQSLPPVPDIWKERYRFFETAKWHGWIDRDLWFEGIEDRLGRPDDFFERRVEKWFKRGRNLLAEVRWLSGDGGPGGPRSKRVVLKKYGSRGAVGAVRNYLRPSRCLRAWDRAFALLDRGFATPRPLWLVRPRNGPRGAPSFLAVEKAPPHIRLREALKQVRAGENEIVLGCGEGKTEAAFRLGPEIFLEELAAFVRRLHDAGVWHRDFSGGNLLIPDGWRPPANGCGGGNVKPEAAAGKDPEPEKNGRGRTCFILIDVNRCHLFPPGALPLRARLHDLERISLDPGRRERFYESYARGDASLLAGREKYLKRTADYRRLRRTRNPALRLWRKVFTYWLRW